MKTIWDFITHFDKDAIRAIAAVLFMFAGFVAILVYGRDILNLPESDVYEIFNYAKTSYLALPVTILVFILAAFIGMPQWALIAGVVLAFGPVHGGVYAWVATMCSASVDFWLGRYIGAERVKRYGGDLITRIINVVRKNGFMTSFAIRLVPTGPFVLVNMAAGVARIKFLSFLNGTALGIIPKITVVVLVAQGVLSQSDSNKFKLIFIALALALIIAMFFARKRLKRNFVLDGDKTNNKGL